MKLNLYNLQVSKHMVISVKYIMITVLFFLFLFISQITQAQYCTNGLYLYGCTDGDDVGIFQLNTINNVTNTCPSNNAGYMDFTGMSTLLQKGQVYNLTVGTSSTQYNQGFGVWIDYNQDNDFNDPNEFVYASPQVGINQFNGSITVPSSALPGPTRLRVRARYNTTVSALESCTTFSYGETEDYTVIIQASIPNDAGVVSIDSPYAFCPGTYNVLATVANYGNNILNSLTVNWSFNGVIQTPVLSSIVLDTIGGNGNYNTQISLGNKTFLANQPYVIKVWTSHPNGLPDTSNINDTLTVIRQPAISGTFTIGGTNPDFPTFSAAANVLNMAGICGPTTFNVRAGTYSENFSLNNIAGTSISSKLIFQSETGDSSSVILNYLPTGKSDNYTVQLNGSSHITLKQMTFQSSGSFYGRVMVINGGSDNITLLNNHFIGANASFQDVNLSLIYSQGNNDDNIFQNNRFEKGSYGIYIEGSSNPVLSTGTFIENNHIESHSVGIYAENQDGIKIRNNFINNHPTTTGWYTGLQIYKAANAVEIVKNKIIASSGSQGVTLEDIAGAASQPAMMTNNFIAVGGNSDAFGLSIYGGTTYLKIYNNSFNIYSPGSSWSPSVTLEINAFGNPSSNIRMLNNIFANTGGGYALYISDQAAIDSMDYNDLYSSGNFIGNWGFDVINLLGWQAASGKDANSLSAKPGFYSDTDLHASSGAINDKAIFISSIITDIDGDIRNINSPDIGADEFTPPASDIGLLGFSKPEKFGCEYIDSSIVEAMIFNYGSAPQHNFQVAFKIYNFLVATETVTDTIQPGDTLFYAFNAKVDLTVPGLYPFSGWTVLSGDAISNNDSLVGYAVNSDSAITIFPYLITFESTAGSLPGGWINDPNDGAENWNFLNTGFPEPEGIPYDHTLNSPQGHFAWIDNDAPHSNAINLMTPCFDLQGLAMPYLEFYYWNPDVVNSIYLHIDVYQNGIWIEDIIPALGYQNSNDWGYQLIDLTSFYGEVLKIRFRAEENGQTFIPDIAIDDIKIFDLPPVNTSVKTIVSPVDGCGLSDIEEVKLIIQHTGYDTLKIGDTISVSFRVNNNNAVTEAFVLPKQLIQFDTISYTFSAVADLFTPGTYNLTVWISANGDIDPTNDTATVKVNNIPVETNFPYIQYFENGNGGWVAKGTNSSWAFGTPSATTINSAASGVNAWATGNLTGDYNSDEDSYVFSPCFDFTGISKPQIVFKKWIHSENNWDGTVLQFSIDNGLSWQVLGAVGDPIGWYNNSQINALPAGQSIGWSGIFSNWTMSKHSLTSLGGQPSVRFRFAFASDDIFEYNGFAFDDIVIGETPIIAIPDTMQDCGFVVLDAGNPGASYSWSTGATTQKITVKTTGTPINQKYFVTVVDPNGLYNSDTVFVILEPGPYLYLGNDTTVCDASSLILDAGNPGMQYAWSDGVTTQTRTVTQDGTYIVAVSDGQGCIKTDTIHITFDTYAVADFSFNQNSGNLGVTFTNSSTNATSYFWDFGDGFTNTNANPVHTYNSPGSYTVTLQATNDCGTVIVTKNVLVNPVGIDELKIIQQLEVFPNPTSDKLKIILSTLAPEKITLSLVDLQGRELLSENIPNFTQQVEREYDLSQLAQGIYMLKIKVGEVILFRKIVLQ